ncbi:MAG: DUF4954 family protein [Ignavibacteria bacterium]|jgi:hypothetical protein|nr:DUF4954 family protein [Ignavibacteria bacterium]MCU7503295.1 DUF4954 family protein [Ignavibacteria bacterium]MCU7515759.1 DUF4954 family protein [Ignavibacteria bacterium]
MDLRNLSGYEINMLYSQGCTADDWGAILVPRDFDTERLRNVHFSGDNILGSFRKKVLLSGGLEMPSGIYHSHIHNCSFGNDVYLNGVGLIANYDVEHDVIIENVLTLATEGMSSFGNGIDIEILNEAGGRKVKIYDRLSSQIAYFLAFYRHKTPFISGLEKMIDDRVKARTFETGRIKKFSRVTNCGKIKNVFIGEFSEIDGALKLVNGSVLSSEENPALIGAGVEAVDFIAQAGSRIENSAILNRCFVGQGVHVGRQYSAQDSAFFANSEAFHGEGCSVFAGPYTVTHHKSTLLIAGFFSFFNAGSATNQSNHMYRLGPVHQGVLERGVKTGSFSYLIWPSRIGAFTALLGKHFNNFDSSDFPFSYISEEDGKSILTPAMNLFSAGTKRDTMKWPLRDRRKGNGKLDLINFDAFSPYTVGRMLNAAAILQDMYRKTPKEEKTVPYKGIEINRLMLRTSARYYEMGVKVFMGQCLVEQIEKTGAKVLDELNTAEAFTGSEVMEVWNDIAGLLAPVSEVNRLVDAVSFGEINRIEILEDKLKLIWQSYQENKWQWCLRLIKKRCALSRENLTPGYLAGLIRDWRTEAVKLNNMILKDAMREFDEISKIGYGIDGSMDEDFLAVRGSCEENSFIGQLKEENAQIEERALKALSILESHIESVHA